MIINAENLILGRMATIAAKKALLGEDVKIINCEKAVIIGNKRGVIKDWLDKLELGQPQQGPFIKRRPDMFVKRSIRGMLPKRVSRGRDALSRVRCYLGTPADLAAGAQSIPQAQAAPGKRKMYITVEELCMHLGQ